MQADFIHGGGKTEQQRIFVIQLPAITHQRQQCQRRSLHPIGLGLIDIIALQQTVHGLFANIQILHSITHLIQHAFTQCGVNIDQLFNLQHLKGSNQNTQTGAEQ